MTSAGQTEESSPLDKALDLGVFAPLGFALEFRRVVPELAEAGRRQVAFSRSLGQAALRTMARSAAAKKAATAPTAETAPKPQETKPVPEKPAAKKAPAKKAPAKKTPVKKVSAKKAAASKKPAAKKAPAKKAPAKKTPAATVPGYDKLTARQIIERSATATAAQRSWMLDRETSGKARKTVLKALERPE